MNAIAPIATVGIGIGIGKSFDLNTFTYNGIALRVFPDDAGKPWFVAADIIRCLGLDASKGTTNFVQSLGADECLRRSPDTLKGFQGKRVRAVNIVSESGLYKIILRAQRSNPAAKDVQDWVTKEVLPRIRRDGAYIMGEEKVATGEDCAGGSKEAHTEPPCAAPYGPRRNRRRPIGGALRCPGGVLGRSIGAGSPVRFNFPLPLDTPTPSLQSVNVNNHPKRKRHNEPEHHPPYRG
ncbi:BRO family protein [Rhodobacter capsulatus]|uniref:BRO family, N-terminal domain n=1 Tax=Rhodobacter capsulatus TaxID=1061 RepID=A0A1G7I2Y9_RHOCA|nr:BRO family protein [Rhodobacter capsulatus]WER11022.1 BRO family protein [Rhodobacter capsulatus]SDF07120.1 BRO family, N-terminal domain [Rhodobacter capsulatus]